MPMTTHTKAAEDHQAAAKAHETAAGLYGKADMQPLFEKSTKAKGCCDTARKSSTDAHAKSLAQANK